jgi:hypothetical protein
MPSAMHMVIVQYAHVHQAMKATLTLNVLKVWNFLIEFVVIVNFIVPLEFYLCAVHYISNNEIFLKVCYDYNYRSVQRQEA